MDFTNAGKNLMLDALTGITAALYTGADYANDEVSGGEVGEEYARVAVTFDAAANGERAPASLPTFNIPAGTTVTHAAYFIGSTRIAEGPVVNESYTSAGLYTLKADSILQVLNVSDVVV